MINNLLSSNKPQDDKSIRYSFFPKKTKSECFSTLFWIEKGQYLLFLGVMVLRFGMNSMEKREFLGMSLWREVSGVPESINKC